MAIALGAGLLVFLLAAAAAADGGQEPQSLELFRKGIAYYEAGEYEDAREAFDSVLAARPGMEEALQMRHMAELGLLIEMRDNEQLGDEADKLLDLMTRAVRERKRTVADPDKLIEDFQSEATRTYSAAFVQLKGHGPYAVPYLLPLLALDPTAEKRTPEEALHVQTLIARTISLLAGTYESARDTCLPLIQVMRGTDDPLLKRRVAGVLGQIGDERAVPALMGVLQDARVLGPTREAAAAAIESIAGQPAGELGPAAALYADVGKAYLMEDAQRVGFTYGLSADVWAWDPGAETLQQMIGYEEVPNYLYYQRMASEAALEGLSVAPGDAELQALLAASQVRQLVLCELFKTAELRGADQALRDQLRQDAADRAAELEVEVPVVLRLLGEPVVARALELTLEAGAGASSLYITRALGAKLQDAGPAAPGQATAAALVAALDSADKEVRYNAAINLVRSCPTGQCGAPGKVISVMGAALKAVAARNGLVLMNNADRRNRLVSALRFEGLETTETRVDEGLINRVLDRQPSIDIIFLSGDVSQIVFDATMEQLAADARTRGAVLYVIQDPTEEGADLAAYDRIERVLTPDHIRRAVLAPLLEEKAFAESRSAFTESEEALVLKATRALSAVDPLNTQYNLVRLEPPLTKALSGYGDEVTAAAIDALADFGTSASLTPLTEVVAGDDTTELKVAACGALAAVLKRSGASLGGEELEVLKAALAGDVQELREAAAEALSAAGLSAEDLMALVRSEGLAED